MDVPTCRGEEMPEVVSKDSKSLKFVTAYIEDDAFGFPCSEAPPAGCMAAPVQYEANGQCLCERWATIYPVAVEEMVIGIDHAYIVDSWHDSSSSDWFGTSRGAFGAHSGVSTT